MNIFKRILQALEKEEEIDRQRQKRLIEVSKMLDACYDSESYYDDMDRLSSSKNNDINPQT